MAGVTAMVMAVIVNDRYMIVVNRQIDQNR